MKTIVGVPESLTRAQYLGLIESVGFDVQRIRNLTFATDGIYAEVLEHNAADTGVLIDNTVSHCPGCGNPQDGAVVNKVFIPVRDD